MVEGQELNDGLRAQETPRSSQGDVEELGECTVIAFPFGAKALVSGSSAKLASLEEEDAGSVGLAQEDGPEDLDEHVQECDGPKGPSPGSVLRDESTSWVM